MKGRALMNFKKLREFRESLCKRLCHSYKQFRTVCYYPSIKIDSSHTLKHNTLAQFLFHKKREGFPMIYCYLGSYEPYLIWKVYII